VGGDLVRPYYINRLRKKYPALKILHMYGPTENTTFSTYLSIDRDYEHTIPIGKPIGKTTVYIIGKGNDLLPVGAVGELCTGGEGVSRGYLNNPELTAERFIELEVKVKAEVEGREAPFGQILNTSGEALPQYPIPQYPNTPST
jgi:non-ribosomal peptide synthetase component F